MSDHLHFIEDEAFQLLLDVNAPSPVNFSPSPAPLNINSRYSYLDVGTYIKPGSRAGFSRSLSRADSSRPTSRLSSISRMRPKSESAAKAQANRIALLDEEAIKTRQFWERWAKEATKQILSKVQLNPTPKPEPIYSGHCGPEAKFRRSTSLESLETNLSLLSCSTLNNGPTKKTIKRKKKKKNYETVDAPVNKPNWEVFAKERHGALDRLIQADKAKLETIVHGMVAKKAIELMSEEERYLLLKAGYSRGLATKQKSHSTANALSVLPKEDKAKLLHLIEKKSSASRASMATHGSGSSQGRNSRRKKTVVPRAPSPKVIGRQVRAQVRPDSAIPIITDPLQSELRRRQSRYPHDDVAFDEFSNDKPSKVNYQHRMFGLPDFQQSQAASRKAKQEMNATLQSLSRITGGGDATEISSMVVHSNSDVHTNAEYARLPMYPQDVRIAPHLAKVIRDDIIARMGRPRHHEIRTHDLRLFDMDQPGLGRTHRNLMIFNWLSSIDENDMEVKCETAIYDIEGLRPNDRYPLFVPGGIVGELISKTTDAIEMLRDEEDDNDDDDEYVDDEIDNEEDVESLMTPFLI